MTLTDRSMEWLNQNRHRAYPLQRDPWRRTVPAGSGLDSVLLDVLVLDNDAYGLNGLSMTSVKVETQKTTVWFRYADNDFHVELAGGSLSGEGSFDLRSGTESGERGMGSAMSASMAFSSHAYILDALGEGEWELNAPVLKGRCATPYQAYGVSAVHTNGSKGVKDRSRPCNATGNVVLEDGYCASPVIQDGRILVRVGRKFGLDPCTFDFEGEIAANCSAPLFFFCGQNATGSGNVVLTGGKGVNVTQGRSYKVRTGSCAGKTVPCIEITAGTELMELYRPDA